MRKPRLDLWFKRIDGDPDRFCDVPISVRAYLAAEQISNLVPQVSPEERLFLAVIRQAISDLGCVDRYKSADALRFIRRTSNPFASHLGISENYIRLVATEYGLLKKEPVYGHRIATVTTIQRGS